ncbi:MAG: hypothetical protein ACI9G1_001985 [Pirellulaceae bacterium]
MILFEEFELRVVFDSYHIVTADLMDLVEELGFNVATVADVAPFRFECSSENGSFVLSLLRISGNVNAKHVTVNQFKLCV